MDMHIESSHKNDLASDARQRHKQCAVVNNKKPNQAPGDQKNMTRIESDATGRKISSFTPCSLPNRINTPNDSIDYKCCTVSAYNDVSKHYADITRTRVCYNRQRVAARVCPT